MFVETHVRHQLFELAVLLFEPFEPTQFCDAKARVFLFHV